MDENVSNVTTLLQVGFNEDLKSYFVNLAAGSNVAETAFAVTVIIKCLIKDKIIEKAEDFTDLVNKYLNDPQYDEVKENVSD